MTTGRNPILIGQAEEFDLVLPQVRAMIENEGVYICGDTVHPAFTVPLVSYDGKILSLVAEAELDPERFIPSFTAHGPYLASTHPDDFAVDRFAAALKAKLAKKRAGGMSGWDDKTACSEERLQTMLVEHLTKGDPVDVGNFAMMLFNRGESCAAPAHGQFRDAAKMMADPSEVPEFSDSARAALLWVLWHHQGGSSPVGQPIRFALGMGQHERLSDWQLSEARRWGQLRGLAPGACRDTAPAPAEVRAETAETALAASREREARMWAVLETWVRAFEHAGPKLTIIDFDKLVRAALAEGAQG